MASAVPGGGPHPNTRRWQEAERRMQARAACGTSPPCRRGRSRWTVRVSIERRRNRPIRGTRVPAAGRPMPQQQSQGLAWPGPAKFVRPCQVSRTSRARHETPSTPPRGLSSPTSQRSRPAPALAARCRLSDAALRLPVSGGASRTKRVPVLHGHRCGPRTADRSQRTS